MNIKKISKAGIIINSLPFISAILVFVLVKLGVRFPFIIEQYYSKGIYPFIANAISMISSMVPCSLWDIFWISILIFIGFGVILVILKKLAFKKFLLRLAQCLAISYSLFYITWGFNYFRPEMPSRLGWFKTNLYEADFRNLLDTLITQTNKNYTVTTPGEYQEIERNLEKSYQDHSFLLGITYPNGSRTPKTIMISSYFAKSGISGYFGPFFNEVHVNYYELPGDYAYVLAHEKAHQFGIANEAEANLTAFIVCTGSSDIRLRYSGYMNLLIYFLDDASDMKDYKDFLKKINPLVLHDIVSRQNYYDRLTNRTLEVFQTAANNAYLKSQNIEKGIKNYDQVVQLAINWYLFSGKLNPGVNSGIAEIP
jgi:hypothetical protein